MRPQPSFLTDEVLTRAAAGNLHWIYDDQFRVSSEEVNNANEVNWHGILRVPLGCSESLDLQAPVWAEICDVPCMEPPSLYVIARELMSVPFPAEEYRCPVEVPLPDEVARETHSLLPMFQNTGRDQEGMGVRPVDCGRVLPAAAAETGWCALIGFRRTCRRSSLIASARCARTIWQQNN